jgi:hypothetical protein
MKSAVTTCLFVALWGCKDETTGRPEGEKPVEITTATAPAPMPMPAPPASVEPELPLSADVLPPGEATPNTRVVVGDGFRYQVPETFKKVIHPSDAAAYSGTVEGLAGPAKLTFWATTEPFTGDLDALVARETQAATVEGGSTDPGPVMSMIKDEVKQGYAKRITIKYADRIELRTAVAYDGKAYLHHCETPNIPNAWANVGSECITRGMTFHVAPGAAPAPPAMPR